MKKKWILLLLITISFTSLTAQDALYPNTFPLGDVRITAGPFKHACDLNVKVLLQYDTDRPNGCCNGLGERGKGQKKEKIASDCTHVPPDAGKHSICTFKNTPRYVFLK